MQFSRTPHVRSYLTKTSFSDYSAICDQPLKQPSKLGKIFTLGSDGINSSYVLSITKSKSMETSWLPITVWKKEHWLFAIVDQPRKLPSKLWEKVKSWHRRNFSIICTVDYQKWIDGKEFGFSTQCEIRTFQKFVIRDQLVNVQSKLWQEYICWICWILLHHTYFWYEIISSAMIWLPIAMRKLNVLTKSQ